MILERFYDDKLAQASYLIGCGATGEALIVDPNRDVEQYIDSAAAENLRITHVAETHIHADFVSGLRELRARTGARAYLSDEGGDDWRYSFAAEDGATLLRAGETFHVGHVRIEALHTPGHTPEHLCFAVTDTASADRAMGVLTGDFVFAGDVGRPDLLEKAAGERGTMQAAARQLFASLQSFKRLPDYVQLWPGHGAGSACGKSLGAVPQTTLGYEKLFNWAFQHEDEAAFVRDVLADQPEPPRYFAHMKRINREGPRVLGGFPRPPRLAPDRLAQCVREASVVDTRPAARHAAARIPGTLNIPLNRSFTTWAGSIMPFDRDFYLLVDDAACPSCIEEAVRDLAMIGLDRVAGWFDASAVEAWHAAGHALETIDDIMPEELYERVQAENIAVIDVRGQSEWDAGHMPGVTSIPLVDLVDRLNDVPRDRTVVVHCQTGSRAAIAASLLRSNDVRHVMNLRGGFAAWRQQGLPVEDDS